MFSKFVNQMTFLDKSKTSDGEVEAETSFERVALGMAEGRQSIG